MRSTSRSTSKPKRASASSALSRRIVAAAAGPADTAALLRREFLAWRASLLTQLERDTLLWPEVIAKSVVQETERFLKTALPADYAGRLAAKAHYLYPRHKHFHKVLNRPGNRSRDNLYVYMRHWTAGWLKRERRRLFNQLPYSFSVGRRLPG